MTKHTAEEYLEEVLKLAGQLAVTEQRLRDLVEAATKVEDASNRGFTGHTVHDDMQGAIWEQREALAAARTLLEGEGK